MTAREMQNAFELEVNKYDSNMIVETNVIFYWLNEAQNHFTKTRYSGDNIKGESFEQSQKRIEDLRALVTEASITTSVGGALNKPNSYIATLPSDYMIALGEEAVITFTDSNSEDHSIRVGTIKSTTDSYNKDIKDPYSEHNMHYESARPLRLYIGDTVELISDGTYEIPTMYLRYLRLPSTIALGGSNDCELPEFAHSEIVSRAVKMYKATIGEVDGSTVESVLEE